MRTSTGKKTLLEKEFQLLIQELKDSGLKVNENFEQENNRNVFEVTFVKKKRNTINVCCYKISRNSKIGS